ncbi:unnamed protein product [[Actinomadura] parvosata subsp. kistnae]|uniref:hypothetical protein n=1 Tax=[Actinomadura] parvosata TaxID=1955412 RepID=UPI0009ADD0CF|nr:hypothetical protein [Nonomuraea sp. ATCC 55076]SPL93949.1 unnamed protein product [Actinomadura parvosata subsp. kistnae]
MFKRTLPALGLLILAPLVGEYLLGNIAINALPMIIGLIPLYGGGALLIREVARRWRLGWPGIILLGLAYAVIEEGLLTRSLFDPNYVGLRLLDYGFIPALGIGAYWTVFVLAIHGVWSIAVPISMVETASRRPDTPWLGKVGLTVSALLFLLGGAVPIAFAGPTLYPLSAAQITWTLITATALITAAFLSARFRRPVLSTASPTPWTVLATTSPAPWTVFTITIAAGLAFWLPTLLALVGIKLESVVPAWITVGFYLTLYTTMTLLILRWSRRTGWGPWHKLALSAAGLLTYAWHSFPQPPSFPAPAHVDLIGNAIFSLAALGLLAFVVVRLRRTSPPS